MAGDSAMKQAKSVPANFGDKDKMFRPDLGGASGNSSAKRPGRDTARDFPGASSRNTTKKMK